MSTIKDYFRTGGGTVSSGEVPNPSPQQSSCDFVDEIEEGLLPNDIVIAEPETVSENDELSEDENVSSDSEEQFPGQNTDKHCSNVRQQEKQCPGPKDISQIPSAGPMQPKLQSYPQTSYGDKNRSFQRAWFDSHPWLEYSQSTDSVFCFACRHFSSPTANVEKSFTNDGYRKWKKAVGNTGGFVKHTHADYHREAMVAWLEYKNMKMHESSVKQMVSNAYQKTVSQNRHFIKTLGQVILLTCTQKLSQRGHYEGDGAVNPGNVIKILRLVASHDNIVKKRLDSGPKNAKYSSPEMQNEIISILAALVREEIVNEVKEAKVFSIIVDETKDVSKTEQLSLVIRYFYKQTLYESFLEFKPAFQLDAEALTKSIFDILQSHEIDYKTNLVGQGYDGASVMSGKHTGVSARVKQIAQFAYYVHCHAHRLNLVLVDVTKAIPGAAQFFSLLERMYVFISGSYVHSKWMDTQKELYPAEQPRELKRLSDTRWACRVDACKVMRHRLSAIIRLFERLSEDSTADRAIEARGLLAQINAKFVSKLVIMTDLLIKTSQLSNMLQSTKLDLAKAVELIEELISQLEGMRSDPALYEHIWNEVQESTVANGFELSDLSEAEPPKRGRKRRLPRHLDNESVLLLEPITADNHLETNQKDAIRTGFFYPILDRMLSEMKRRFSTESCAIMKAMQSLNPKSAQFLDYERMHGLINAYQANSDDLKHELYSAKRLLERRVTETDGDEANPRPESLLEFVTLLEPFEEAFPELYRLAKIALVLPVSSAAAERSFSALKLIKTTVRNSMGNTRLSNLGLLSIENERVNRLDLEMFVDKFADNHNNRRIHLK